MKHTPQPLMFDEDNARKVIADFFQRPDVIADFAELERAYAEDATDDPDWWPHIYAFRGNIDWKFGKAFGLELQVDGVGSGRFSGTLPHQKFDHPVAYGVKGRERTEMLVVHNYWKHKPDARGLTVMRLPRSSYFPNETTAFLVVPSLVMPPKGELRALYGELGSV